MGLFSRSEDFKETDKYVELEVEETGEVPENKVKIIIEKVESFVSADKVLRNVRDGNIVFAKIKELKESNLDELKSVISKIRTHVTNMGGDIVGAGDEWIIVTPSSVKIHRDEAV